jgi:hypothetical protein
MKQSTFGSREGFQLLRDHFPLPKDIPGLNPKTQQAVTICNLFLNEKLGIDDIVRLLNEKKGMSVLALNEDRENRRSVVLALIEQGVIQERRKKTREAPDGK